MKKTKILPTQDLPEAILVLDGLWPTNDRESESSILVVHKGESVDEGVKQLLSSGHKVAVYKLTGEELPIFQQPGATMKPEEKLVAIAKSHGFKNIQLSERGGFEFGWHGEWDYSTGKQPPGLYSGHIPDYLNDLNAIKSAVDLLTREELIKFTSHLLDICGSWPDTVNASASQRADAYLITKGLLEP